MTKERVGTAAKPAEKTLTSSGEAIASAPHPSSSAVAVVVAVARPPCPPEPAGPRPTLMLPRPSIGLMARFLDARVSGVSASALGRVITSPEAPSPPPPRDVGPLTDA